MASGGNGDMHWNHEDMNVTLTPKAEKLNVQVSFSHDTAQVSERPAPQAIKPQLFKVAKEFQSYTSFL